MSKKSHGNNIVNAVWDLSKPIANRLGIDIWDIKFLKEGSGYYLRIFIDSKDGVTIEDCEKFSRAIDAPLDEMDLISQNYCLEVSSPGIERELTRDEHFEKFIGDKIIIRLIRPTQDGTKQLNGRLLSFNKDEIEISYSDLKSLSIPRKNVAFVKLDDFEK